MNDNPGACILMWSKPHGHKEHMRPFQMVSCISYTWDCFMSPSLNRCLFKWQCPVQALSIFLAGFCSDWAIPLLFLQRVLRKPLAFFRPCMDCQCSSYFLHVQSLNTPMVTFAEVLSTGSGLISGCEQPGLGILSATSFPSIPMCAGTCTNWFPTMLQVSPGIDGSSRLILNLSGYCQEPWWLPDCQEEYRCSYLCSCFLHSPLHKS